MSVTQLFFINLVILITLIIIESIYFKDGIKNRFFNAWLNIHSNLTFLSIPCFIIYSIVVLF